MKIGITDEEGNVVNTLTIPFSAIIDVTPGVCFEIKEGRGEVLNIWAGRMPCSGTTRDDYRGFIVEPLAGNIIALRHRE